MFRRSYSLICWLLLLTQLALLGLLAYTRVIFGKVLYYGDPDNPNPGFENYFRLLQALFYGTLVLIFLWAIVTPYAVLWNRKSRLELERVDLLKGGIGFILAIALLLADPFGIFRLFTLN